MWITSDSCQRVTLNGFIYRGERKEREERLQRSEMFEVI